MKLIARMALGLGLAICLLPSCDDDLSRLGESVQTPKDKVESEQYNLQFDAKTVAVDEIYNGDATEGLLGGYADDVYGSFKADFVTQLRTAPGFTFSQTPQDGSIDSVTLRLSLPASGGYVGSATAPMQISVYEVPSGFQSQDYSVRSLSEYAVDSRLLGERVITVAQDTTVYQVGQGLAYAISLKLNKELGQRFYNATQQNPAYFQTQDSFNKNILGGLYVTTTTGLGAVLRIQATALDIHYHYMQGDSVRRATERFINTKLTGHMDGINATGNSTLLANDGKYLYSKGPADVQTAVSLSKAQMERLLAGQPASLAIGTSWTLADTQLKLEIDNPTDLRLNPPSYMMLMPADSVKTYFKKGLTERTASAISYLSTAYSSTAQYYNFYNISRLLTEHLKHHAAYKDGRWTVDADLDLRLVPVQRQVSSSGSSSSSVVTTGISEYLFPSFVRFKYDTAALKIGVVVSIFK